MAPAEDDWEMPPEKELAPEPDFRPIPRRPPKKRRGLWVLVGVVVVAGGLGAGGWYFLNDWLAAEPDGEVPLIHAESGPIKVRPDEPGGMEVPDQDKLVYDRIDGNAERNPVERLLPPPETPLPKPVPAPGSEQAAAPGASSPMPTAPEASAKPMTPPPPPPAPPGTVGGTGTATSVAPTPAPQKVVPSVEDVLAAMQPPPAVETRKEPAPAVSAAKPAPAKAPVAAKSGTFQVQLSALRNREQVDSEWDRLRRRNSDLLGSLELSVVRADLGPGKGVFFRLRAGPLADEQAAKALCQKLSERKIGCLVVRPEG